MGRSFSKFLYAYSREDLLRELRFLEQQKNTSAYPTLRRDLVDHLRGCGIECDDDCTPGQLKEKVAQAPERDVLIRRLILELDQIWRQFPTPADHMENTVRTLGDRDLQDFSVRLTILRHFLRYGPKNNVTVRRLAQRMYGESVPANATAEQLVHILRDDIFDVLTGKLSKDDRRKYELLICADDLAKGRFRQQGKAKMDLYRFAFAFGMTASVPGKETVPDRDRDVTVRLFEDHYQNNILRYLASRNISDGSEAEPVGEGINPKNFAETIFIYFLRKEGLSRYERYRQAEAMIEQCLKLAEARGGTVADPLLKVSADYWDRLMAGVWDLEPEALATFICDHYDIPVDAGNRSRIAVAWEGRTSLTEFVKILDSLPCTDVIADRMMLEMEVLSGGIGRYLDDHEICVDAGLRQLMEQMERWLGPEIPESHLLLAALLEDRRASGMASRVMSPAVCLRAVESLLQTVPKDTALLSVRQKLEGLWARSEDTEHHTLVRTVDDALRDHRKWSGEVEKRIAQVRGLLEDAFESYQKEMVRARRSLGPDDVKIPDTAVIRTRIAARQLLTAYQQAMATAAEAKADGERTLERIGPVLDRLAQLDPKWAKLAPQCADAVAKSCGSVAPALLAQGLTGVQALVQGLDGWSEKDPPALPFLSTALEEEKKKLQRTHRVGRTQLVAIAFQAFMEDAAGERMSMPELLEELRTSIDSQLKACRFQPISEKNLFDMFAVIVVYLRLVLGRR